MSLRRGRNLADMVVNAKPRIGEGKSGLCGKGCKLCGYVEEVEEVEDQRGRMLRMKGVMDCSTVGAVYEMCCRRYKRVVYGVYG